MPMFDSHRGHLITQVTPDTWVYSDTQVPVSENPNRECGHCRLPNRPDKHDACLGVLPRVMNACCGHGDETFAYTTSQCTRCGEGVTRRALYGGYCDHCGEEPGKFIPPKVL